jgi:hypothetical protein
MPGYIHTCEKCGAHMQVHERYLGRTLRCTSCRTEFLAMLPEGEEAVEPAPVEVQVTSTSKSWSRHLRWLLILLPLALLVWWFGTAQDSSLLKPRRAFGELGVLETDSGAPVVAALDPDSARVLVKAGDVAEDEELQFLVDQGRGIEVPRGTRVRVLESSDRGRVTRVRIISGPWESRKVWVPTRWVH